MCQVVRSGVSSITFTFNLQFQVKFYPEILHSFKLPMSHKIKFGQTIFLRYSARRLIGPRTIESAAYCNQILLVQFRLNSTL
jgi:hypothetical protein